MNRGPYKVLLDEKLADWSAAYLAMWKALESFDPKADRWSEPVDFGDAAKRHGAAEIAIARAQRHGSDTDKDRDILRFQEQFSSREPDPKFLSHLRGEGSRLADDSVRAVQPANR